MKALLRGATALLLTHTAALASVETRPPGGGTSAPIDGSALDGNPVTPRPPKPAPASRSPPTPAAPPGAQCHLQPADYTQLMQIKAQTLRACSDTWNQLRVEQCAAADRQWEAAFQRYCGHLSHQPGPTAPPEAAPPLGNGTTQAATPPGSDQTNQPGATVLARHPIAPKKSGFALTKPTPIEKQLEQSTCWAGALVTWMRAQHLPFKPPGRILNQRDLINYYAYEDAQPDGKLAPRLAPNGGPYLGQDKSLLIPQIDQVMSEQTSGFGQIIVDKAHQLDPKQIEDALRQHGYLIVFDTIETTPFKHAFVVYGVEVLTSPDGTTTTNWQYADPDGGYYNLSEPIPTGLIDTMKIYFAR